MITLFRKIRKKFIKGNKFTQYLIYAIGEIILVVIGILIAIQINNANDQRKNKVVEKELLVDLIENLEINISQLEDQLEWDHRAIHSGNIILKVIEQDLDYDDSLAYHFQSSRLVANPFLSSSTYKSIENKGFDIISSKDLRKKIIKLYDDTYPSMIKDLNNIDVTIMKPSMQAYMIEHFEYNKFPFPKDFEALKKDQKYKNILSFNVFIQDYFVRNRQECLEEIRSLLADIKEELKNF